MQILKTVQAYCPFQEKGGPVVKVRAIAGIACGLPIVGHRAEEKLRSRLPRPVFSWLTLLADPGDLVGIAEALRRVLCDAKFRDEMRRRSLAADQKYLSWDAITEQFLRALSGV